MHTDMHTNSLSSKTDRVNRTCTEIYKITTKIQHKIQYHAEFWAGGY